MIAALLELENVVFPKLGERVANGVQPGTFERSCKASKHVGLVNRRVGVPTTSRDLPVRHRSRTGRDSTHPLKPAEIFKTSNFAARGDQIAGNWLHDADRAAGSDVSPASRPRATRWSR